MAYRRTIRYQRKGGVEKTDSDENERHEETASAETHLGGGRRPLRLGIGRGMGFIPDLENLGGSGQSKIGDALQEN